MPRYLWGPPPPYSQPPSIENIREASENTSEVVTNSNPSGPTSGSDLVTSGSISGNTLVQSANNNNNTASGSARTTRSGLLQNIKDYDETVKSAMHLYERTVNVINSNSLPSRRIRKTMKSNLKTYMAQSVANLQRTLKEEEEAALFSEVRQKLNALNGMYR